MCALDVQAPSNVTAALQEGRLPPHTSLLAHKATCFMTPRARAAPREVDRRGTARGALRSLSHVLAQDMTLHTTKEAT